MPKTKLNDDDKMRLIEAMNDDVEPSPDLLPKLFPGTAEKFDVIKLDRAKVPTLEYAGKRSKAAILAEAGAGSGPLQVERCFGCKAPEKDDDYSEWRNLIVQGDNLQFLKSCYKNEDPLIKDRVKGKVDLIYIDPPFGTGDEYGGSGGEHSYSAKIKGSEFLELVRERIVLMKELLAPNGIIVVRQGYNFGSHVKIILHEIFGPDLFINELAVNRGKQRFGGSRSYSTAADWLFVYANGGDYFFKGFMRKRLLGEAKGTNMLMRGHRNPPQRDFKDPNGKIVTLLPPNGQHWKFIQPKIDKMYEKDIMYLAKSRKGLESGIRKVVEGKEIPVDYVPSFRFDDDKTIDSNWTDISGYDQTVNYPTENSESLLERVLQSFSEPENLVIDFFGGSGTTAAVAEKLGRRWISCDFGKHAIYTQQRRLLRIGESKALEDAKNSRDEVVIKKGDKYGHNAKPFCVASVGAYDFSHVMSLREHKDRYVDFVLGLFQLSRDKKVAQAYKLANIFAEKEKNPVEVYPVWEDEYLKEIRIDEDYLKSIVEQAGTKLSRDYYIITPETCSNIGETTLKNGSDKVTFHILSFPYKVLEDASRHFQLHDTMSVL